MNRDDCYLAMDIECRSTFIQRLVWYGKNRGWRSIEEAESCGFRQVLKLPSKEIWQLRDEMLASGWLGGADYERYKNIQLQVRRVSDRPIYVFYQWDEDEGNTIPLASIRCDGMCPAIKWFQANLPDQWKNEYQVRHISDCFSDWEKISQLNLEVDLIAENQGK